MKKSLLLLLLIIPLNTYAIEPDKEKHLIAGAFLGTTTTLMTSNWKMGTIAGCGAGLWKEFIDSKSGGTPDPMDFAYTCAGSFLASYTAGRIIMYRNNRMAYVGARYSF